MEEPEDEIDSKTFKGAADKNLTAEYDRLKKLLEDEKQEKEDLRSKLHDSRKKNIKLRLDVSRMTRELSQLKETTKE